MTCEVPSILRTSSMVMNIGLNRTWECFSARAFNQYFSKNAFSSDVQLIKQVWKLGGPSEEVVNRKYVQILKTKKNLLLRQTECKNR